MAVTMQEVRAVLDPEEPDYEQAAQLGPDALPHLESLVREADPMLASKAAYLASLIPASQSVQVIRQAAQSIFPEVRVAAAAGVSNLRSEDAKSVLPTFLGDPDVGVRKFAARSEPVVAARAAVEELREVEPSAAEQTAHLSSLAFALNILALRLIEADRLDEASAVTQETVETYRQAAASGADLLWISEHLVGLSSHLAEVQHHDDTVATAQAAVDILRGAQPAVAQQTAYLSALAFAWNMLALRLMEAGRIAEAATAGHETVQAYRQAAAAGGADIPWINEHLRGLSAHLAAVGLHDVAAQAEELAASLQ